ncbi:sn-glycerol-3-phosphate ABC transporter ATP-binding protein UgpC [Solibacillus sp. FSL H8-0538]|uniref:ABC transporter ATP-binding protein n=1 Tax=Solibacillus sp. FSL H8-0538 TaxID=2921400 RepID=UPI0030FB2D45
MLEFDHLYKTYPDGYVAVTDFHLEVAPEEFIVLVGPSGCGKSTTLRMVAGLEDISQGELRIEGIRVNDVQPKDRDIAMVFQNYALYPHMNVYDNMAFGLKLRKLSKDAIDQRVRNAADILGLQDLLTKKPKSLSGGQRQRVALGRAIVRDAKLFLMDEPLSNLDAKLRVQMRSEITKLHQRLKTTTLYVTHDQTEAMTMATRLVVMKDGYIQQIGSPREVYDFPENVFVGGFIGSPAMNFFKGIVQGESIEIGSSKIQIPPAKLPLLKEQNYIGKEIIFGIRPENISNDAEAFTLFPQAVVDVKVQVAELTGAEIMIYTALDDQSFVAKINADSTAKPGDNIQLVFDLTKAHFFDPETEKRIR